MLLQTVLEGLGLGALLALVCVYAVNGAQGFCGGGISRSPYGCPYGERGLLWRDAVYSAAKSDDIL